MNYVDMDIVKEEESPTRRKTIPSFECLWKPSRPRNHAQRVITRNRLQKLAIPNSTTHLIGTAIKTEDVKPVKIEK